MVYYRSFYPLNGEVQTMVFASWTTTTIVFFCILAILHELIYSASLRGSYNVGAMDDNFVRIFGLAEVISFALRVVFILNIIAFGNTILAGTLNVLWMIRNALMIIVNGGVILTNRTRGLYQLALGGSIFLAVILLVWQFLLFYQI